jgi:HEAT repeat protein
MKKIKSLLKRPFKSVILLIFLFGGSLFLISCSPSKITMDRKLGVNQVKSILPTRQAALHARQPVAKKVDRETAINLDQPAIPDRFAILSESAESAGMTPDSILALALSKEQGTVAKLVSILQNNPDAQNRRGAAVVLGLLGDPAAIPELRAGLLDPDCRVKLEAAVALVRLADYEAAFPVLANIALREDVDHWKLIGAQELSQVAPAELRGKYLPAKALLALSQIHTDKSMGVIEKCLSDQDAFVRTWSCLLLLDLGREADAIPVLIQMARDSSLDKQMRSEVLTILAKEKKRETVESLRFLSRDQDEFIAHKAQTLLAEYGGS